jgi:hypothetical protein
MVRGPAKRKMTQPGRKRRAAAQTEVQTMFTVW